MPPNADIVTMLEEHIQEKAERISSYALSDQMRHAFGDNDTLTTKYLLMHTMLKSFGITPPTPKEWVKKEMC